MNAPVCPISRSQPTTAVSKSAPLQPSIPLATDLSSLIAAINAMADIARSLTTSLTVNNVQLPFNPIPPNVFVTSPYPDWYKASAGTSLGYVYSSQYINQRAYVNRTNYVEFLNDHLDNDTPFYWRYTLPFSPPPKK